MQLRRPLLNMDDCVTADKELKKAKEAMARWKASLAELRFEIKALEATVPSSHPTPRGPRCPCSPLAWPLCWSLETILTACAYHERITRPSRPIKTSLREPRISSPGEVYRGFNNKETVERAARAFQHAIEAMKLIQDKKNFLARLQQFWQLLRLSSIVNNRTAVFLLWAFD
jgi:hypothetical protein